MNFVVVVSQFFFFFFCWNFSLPFCHRRFWQQTAPAAAVTTNNSRWRIFLMMRKHFVGFLFFSAGRRHLIPKSWLHIILCSNICCVVLRTNEAFLSRHCDMSYANRFFFFCVCVILSCKNTSETCKLYLWLPWLEWMDMHLCYYILLYCGNVTEISLKYIWSLWKFVN